MISCQRAVDIAKMVEDEELSEQLIAYLRHKFAAETKAEEKMAEATKRLLNVDFDLKSAVTKCDEFELKLDEMTRNTGELREENRRTLAKRDVEHEISNRQYERSLHDKDIIIHNLETRMFMMREQKQKDKSAIGKLSETLVNRETELKKVTKELNAKKEEHEKARMELMFVKFSQNLAFRKEDDVQKKGEENKMLKLEVDQLKNENKTLREEIEILDIHQNGIDEHFRKLREQGLAAIVANSDEKKELMKTSPELRNEWDRLETMVNSLKEALIVSEETNKQLKRKLSQEIGRCHSLDADIEMLVARTSKLHDEKIAAEKQMREMSNRCNGYDEEKKTLADQLDCMQLKLFAKHAKKVAKDYAKRQQKEKEEEKKNEEKEDEEGKEEETEEEDDDDIDSSFETVDADELK